MLNKKRGYFFVIDAVLGLAVIIIGIFLITASYNKVPQQTQVTFLANDLMNFLSHTKIKNLNNPYGGIGGELWNKGEITNGELSIMQQAGIFYKSKKTGIADKFLQNVSNGIVPSQFNYEIWIDSTIIFPNPQTKQHNVSRNSSELLLTSKQITFGILNQSTGEMFGPYKAEVFVWQK